MIYYKLVKVTIHVLGLAKVILNILVWHHDLSDSIVTDKGSLFNSKFLSLLCYFLGTKRKFLTAFYSLTDGQTKWQNSTIEKYVRAFVNFEQNDWAKFLTKAEFVYNNANNSSTGHMPFKLNFVYHLHMSYKKNNNPYSKLKSTEKLSIELQEVMLVYRENLHHIQKL